jgi:hypothetical protein
MEHPHFGQRVLSDALIFSRVDFLLAEARQILSRSGRRVGRILALEWVFRAIVIGEVGLDMTPCFVDHTGKGFGPSAGRAGKRLSENSFFGKTLSSQDFIKGLF